MGTRSLTFVKDHDNEPVINMYRQFDGYPSGMGADLFRIPRRITHSKRHEAWRKQTYSQWCTLSSCSACESLQSRSAGGIYLYPTTDTDCWQEYEYHIQVVENSKGKEVLHIQVYDNYKKEWLFKGTVRRFKNWINKLN